MFDDQCAVELDALVTALHATQERRLALERELTTLDSPSRELADRRRIRAALTRRAADLHGVLIRREPEARRVLQALFVERLAFAPFDEGPTRGYQFFRDGKLRRLDRAYAPSGGGDR